MILNNSVYFQNIVACNEPLIRIPLGILLVNNKILLWSFGDEKLYLMILCLEQQKATKNLSVFLGIQSFCFHYFWEVNVFSFLCTMSPGNCIVSVSGSFWILVQYFQKLVPTFDRDFVIPRLCIFFRQYKIDILFMETFICLKLSLSNLIIAFFISSSC